MRRRHNDIAKKWGHKIKRFKHMYKVFTPSFMIKYGHWHAHQQNPTSHGRGATSSLQVSAALICLAARANDDNLGHRMHPRHMPKLDVAS